MKCPHCKKDIAIERNGLSFVSYDYNCPKCFKKIHSKFSVLHFLAAFVLLFIVATTVSYIVFGHDDIIAGYPTLLAIVLSLYYARRHNKAG
ncbi:hypothetical protein CWI84_04545 [Idiomarina tyrosinivorans]|uniref:Uncharacterized protein n=1 Tax=Idiomarina tyrosinivorans TaxID=1445662 RepID=A0A432ZSJ0_9GAMM|nr:hypothetical protein CWI84_04545 [Idiomarina tyrosinivorans]